MAKYLIAVGGTGMRCLESFVHLCAIGMLDNEEVNVLIIDTDFAGGNMNRTTNLIDTYRKVKSINGDNGTPLKDSFFSAVVNLYKFIPTYKSPTNTFNRIRAQSKSTNATINAENDDLADLFFEDDTQDFDLEHGYRAQTHLGSYLMYNDIIDEVKKTKKGDGIGAKNNNGLTDFIQLLGIDSDAKVFILGSIFGGTGASSIPVIPQALREASKVLGVTLIDIKFGSTLLSEYFTFNTPDDEKMSKDKIIAKANAFRLNSQAALMYYNSSHTVKEDYQHFYMIGWPEAVIDYGEVITGGAGQLNPAHVVELTSAFAAYHFFNSEDKYDKNIHQWQFRTFERDQTGVNLKFDFADFIGEAKAKKFKLKLAAFFSMNLMLNNEYHNIDDSKKAFLSFYNVINQGRVSGEVTQEESEALNNYIKYFSFYYNKIDERVELGWLFQVKKSTNATSFLFEEDAFSVNYDKLKKIEWGNILPNHHFAKPNKMEKMIGRKVSFNTFSEAMKNNVDKVDFKSIAKTNEKVLKWMYHTYDELFKV